MYSKLKYYRFDPPGNWRWQCRFSLEELKTIYRKLFDFNKFELYSNHSIAAIKDYDVRRDDVYGAVKLEDGGYTSLEFKSKEELDWFLFIGASFGIYAGYDICWKANPLFGKLDRESALICLDLLNVYI